MRLHNFLMRNRILPRMEITVETQQTVVISRFDAKDLQTLLPQMIREGRTGFFLLGLSQGGLCFLEWCERGASVKTLRGSSSVTQRGLEE